MKVLTLTGIPSPEAFFEVKPGVNLSLYYEDVDTDSSAMLAPVKELGMTCLALVMGGGGVSLTGRVTSPPKYSDRTALVDIFWDTHPGYSGQAAISDIQPAVNQIA